MRTKLEAHGWKVGGAADFLELSDEEAAYIELKLKLARRLKEARTLRGLTQEELAKRLDPASPALPKWKRATVRYRWICLSSHY